jgi:hypothetical protein
MDALATHAVIGGVCFSRGNGVSNEAADLRLGVLL